MLSFVNPGFLILLVGLPLWMRSRRSFVGPSWQFSSLPLLAARTVPVRSRRWSRAAILACLLFVLSGPQIPDERTRLPARGSTLMFVLDVSGSMQTVDYRWQPNAPPISRAEAARRAFVLLVRGGEVGGTTLPGRSGERGTDAIGSITFADWPMPLCPPTLSHDVLLSMLVGDRIRGITENGTNIGDAVALGVERLDRGSTGRKVLILLSDGEHNVDRDDENKPLKPRQAAQLAATLGIPIYAIDIGGDPAEGATEVERQQRADGRVINEAIARMTSGRSFDAADGPKLLEAIREIDALERTPVASPQFRRYFDLRPFFYGLIGSLFLAMVVREWWWQETIPD